MGSLSLGEDVYTENIDIIGKKGEESQIKSMNGAEKKQNVVEVSNQGFPLLSRAREGVCVRSVAPQTGSSQWLRLLPFLPRMPHSR